MKSQQRVVPDDSGTLELRRVLPVPREQVFDAWTRADVIPRWFKPGDVPLRQVEVDLRVGGQWRMTMGTPGAREMVGTGVFREVDRPRRVAYTWNWDPDPVGCESLVTIDFLDRGGETEIVLRQTGFPTKRTREQHAGGWTACLDALDEMFSVVR